MVQINLKRKTKETIFWSFSILVILLLTLGIGLYSYAQLTWLNSAVFFCFLSLSGWVLIEFISALNVKQSPFD